MLNKVFLTGRTTREIDLRRTEKGTPVVQFTLAVENRINKDADGKPTTDFIGCIAWNKLAETMEKYVKKGKRITIVGRLQTRNYENKEGNKVYITEVVVEQLDLIDYADSKVEEKNDKYESEIVEDSSDIYYVSEDDLPF